jgi:tetratricopeptide (TPR) repeat protein
MARLMKNANHSAPPSGSTRLRALGTVAAVLALTLSALSIVRPNAGRATVAVSRFGAGVRLLPRGLAFSFLPLEMRVPVDRVDSAAVLQAVPTVPIGEGLTAKAEVRLHVEGSGRLPLDAGTVRESGWPTALQRWLGSNLALSTQERDSLISTSELWRKIFPTIPRANPVDVSGRLAPLLAPLRVARAELRLIEIDELVRALARQQLRDRQNRPGRRLVVLGLDALDWRLVDELVARGQMPNLGRLLGRGASAVLLVPEPLISPVVWTTIATGVPPETHGVLDFLEPDPSGGPMRPVTTSSRKVPALWEMAAASGRSSAVIGWWATYPARAPSDGTVYSDRLTEQLLGLGSQVPGLADPPAADEAARSLMVRADQVTPAMLAPLVPVTADELRALSTGEDAWQTPIGGLAKLMSATFTVERLTTRELERGTAIVLSYLEGTDTVGHLFGPYRPPAMPGTDASAAARFGQLVDRYHGHVDRWIGQVVAQLGREDTLVILSDHGFTWGADRPRVAAGVHTATAALWHRPEGFFFAVGPTVAPSNERHHLGVIDVAPALLALAGLPRAAEMPGRSPAWLGVDESTRAEVSFAALIPPAQLATAPLPPEAVAEEMAKLRALGYLAGASISPTQGPSRQTASAPQVQPTPAPQVDRAEARRLNNLGISRAAAGDRAGAEAAFKQAVVADPGYAAAYYNYSTLLRKQARLDDADATFWTAVKLGIQERELAVVRLALDYRERGNVEKATQVLAQGRQLLPTSATIWLNSGVFHGELGELAQARDYLQEAVRLDARNPAAHRNLAAALLALGDTAGARRALTEASKLEPSNEETRRQLDALGGPLDS